MACSRFASPTPRAACGPPPRWAVLNRDDRYARELKLDPATRVIWYGLGREAQLRAGHIASNFHGLRFDVQFGKLRFAVDGWRSDKIPISA